MIATISHNERIFRVNLDDPLDISIPLKAGDNNVNAWYCPPVKIEAVVMGDWIGEVKQGGSVNFRNIFFNPHGNGTHTECVGHISKEDISLNQVFRQFIFVAELITVAPQIIKDDLVITREQLQNTCRYKNIEALVIRTIPNDNSKLSRHYSNSNPPYLQKEAAEWMVEKNIQHLLLDVPSVDREKDDGLLLAHHAFWQYPFQTRMNATITELIFVDSQIPDGEYLLNIQVTSLENDASPCKPVLYKIM
jgi:arylformamidase